MNVDLLTVFGIGLLTLATPCVLPLVPIYLGMLLGSSVDAAREPGARARLVTATVAFAAGFALVFTLLGLGASAVGGFLQDHRFVLTVVGGGVIVLFGLKFLGVLRLPWADRELRLPRLRTGARLLDAALFGVVFALAWTPCVGPVLGSVLTLTATRAADPLTGALYLATYSLGVALPLLVLSAFADRLLPLLSKANRRLPAIERATGALLVLLGGGLIVSSIGLPGGADHSDDGPLAHDGASLGVVVPPIGAPSGRPRIVEVYEQDCSACEQARSRVEGLRSDCAGRQIDILALDASDRRNREVARQLRVSMVPTFVLLDAAGGEVGRLVGAPELDELRRAAATLLAARCAGVAADEDESGERRVGAGCPGELGAPGGNRGDDSDSLALDEHPSCEG